MLLPHGKRAQHWTPSRTAGYAVGASLRPPSGRPPLRAHRVANPGANHLPTQSITRFLAELPYHPHIQHREPRYTYHYLSAAPDLLAHAARLLNDAQAVRS